MLLQGTNQQIRAHEASSAVQHVNLLKEWSSSLEKKVGRRGCWPARRSTLCTEGI